jgi:VWFA-related protein
MERVARVAGAVIIAVALVCPVASQTRRPQVLVHVSIMGPEKQYIARFEEDDVVLREEGKPRVATFLGADLPASVVFVVDVSRSNDKMFGKKGERLLEPLKQAIKRFAAQRETQTEYSLVAFADRPVQLCDFTTDPGVLIDRLRHLQSVTGRTALYDTCVFAVQKASAGSHPKHVVVLITDGQDNLSKYSFGELRRMIDESNVVIYSILAAGQPREFELLDYGASVLTSLTEMSGGSSATARTLEQLPNHFESIAFELRYQHTYGFAPSRVKGAKTRDLEVRLADAMKRNPKLKRFSVRARTGYRSLEP